MISNCCLWLQRSKKIRYQLGRFFTSLQTIFVSKFIFSTFAHKILFILLIMIGNNDLLLVMVVSFVKNLYSPIFDLSPNYFCLLIHFFNFHSTDFLSNLYVFIRDIFQYRQGAPFFDMMNSFEYCLGLYWILLKIIKPLSMTLSLPWPLVMVKLMLLRVFI